MLVTRPGAVRRDLVLVARTRCGGFPAGPGPRRMVHGSFSCQCFLEKGWEKLPMRRPFHVGREVLMYRLDLSHRGRYHRPRTFVASLAKRLLSAGQRAGSGDLVFGRSRWVTSAPPRFSG